MNRTEIIWDMPIEVYRTEPGVSKSFLDEFSRCPLAGFEYMQSGSTRETTKAMVLGSAVDCLICEPDKFDARFYIRPSMYPSGADDVKAWNSNAAWCRDWVKSHQDRPILTKDELDEARRMADAVLSEPKAKQILAGTRIQASVFWTDPHGTELQLKGRPDFVGTDYCVDLKTCRDASDAAISRAIASYRYYVQAAIYLDGLKANGRECEAFYFVFVEPGDRPKVNVRKLKQEAIELGRYVYNDQLLKVRDCYKSGVWPGFSGVGQDILEIDVPAYTYSSNGGDVTLTISGQDLPL